MPIDYALLVVLILISAALGMYLYIHKKSKISATDVATEKSYEIIHQASKKAQDILSTAEMDAIKLESDAHFYKNKLEGGFEEQLKASLNQATQDYLSYLNYLKNNSEVLKTQNQADVKQQISNSLLKFEEKLSQFLLETQQRSTQSIDMELQAARNLIESYKQQQLKVVDENIIAMLEKTISLVLAKKLSLEDQVDLVYDALEKAKAEKFIL